MLFLSLENLISVLREPRWRGDKGGEIEEEKMIHDVWEHTH